MLVTVPSTCGQDGLVLSLLLISRPFVFLRFVFIVFLATIFSGRLSPVPFSRPLFSRPTARVLHLLFGCDLMNCVTRAFLVLCDRFNVCVCVHGCNNLPNPPPPPLVLLCHSERVCSFVTCDQSPLSCL